MEEEHEEIIPLKDEVAGIDLAKELAEWQKGVDGFVASAVIKTDGTYIAGTCNVSTMDLSLSVAYCAKTLHSIVDNLNATKLGNWEEILITTDTHHMIFQKLNDDIFLSLTLDKAQGNLGLSRLQMERFTKGVSGELT